MPYAAALLGFLLLAGPAAAQAPFERWSPQDTEEWQQAQKYAQEGAESLVRSFEMLLRTMPYGLPQIDADGNIVIPRQHPHALPPGRRDGDRT